MILCYHKVFLESPSSWWVAVDEFYRQMCELRGYDVVLLDQYDPSNPRHAVITFDGIYTNVLEYAAPIMRHFNYPFELFLSGDHVGLDNSFDAPEPPAKFASRDELKKLVAMGGRLQWHTRSHPNLTTIRDSAALARELTVPDDLRALDPQGFGWFAYPYGAFDHSTLAALEGRFRGAVSCHQGDGVSRFQLNRVIVTNQTSLRRATTSVIIPSYNYGGFLIEAVESVLRQTRMPNEILIVDDASSDNTAEIGQSYAKRFPQLIRFHRNKKNLGIVANFNLAVSLTTSDYVCFLGADNRFRSDYVERTTAILDADPTVGVAYTDYALFGHRAPLEYDAFPVEFRAGVKEGTFHIIQFPDFDPTNRHKLRERNFIHGSSLFRRQAFSEAGGYRDAAEMPEDHNLFVRMVERGWNARRVAAPLLEYRHHSFEQANSKLSAYKELVFYKQLLAEQRAANEQLGVSLRDAEARAREVEAARARSQAAEAALADLGQQVADLRGELQRESLNSNALQQRIVASETRLHLLLTSRQWKVGGLVKHPGLALSKIAKRLKQELSGLGVNRLRKRVEGKLRGMLRRLCGEAGLRDGVQPRFTLITQRDLCTAQQLVWDGNAERSQAIGLLPGVSLSWECAIPGQALDAVQVLCATYARRAAGDLVLVIRDADTLAELAQCRISAAQIVDNSYATFFLPKRIVGVTRWRFSVSGEGAPEGLHLALWCAPRHPAIEPTLKQVISADTLVPVREKIRIPDVRPVTGESGFVAQRHFFDAASFTPAPIPVRGDPLMFEFFLSRKKLRALVIPFATYGRTNRCRVVVALADLTSGEVLYREEVQADTLVDNGSRFFSFPVIDCASDRWLQVRISSPDASENDCVAVWGSEVRSDWVGFQRMEAHQPSGKRSLLTRSEEVIELEAIGRDVTPLPRKSGLQRAIVLSDEEQWYSPRQALRSVVDALRAGEISVSAATLSSLQGFRELETTDLLIVDDLPFSERLGAILAAAARANVAVVGLLSYNVPSVVERDELKLNDEQERAIRYRTNHHRDTLFSCDWVFCDRAELPELVRDHPAVVSVSGWQEHDAVREVLREIVSRHQSDSLPRVSIVTVLYAKQRELPFFLEAIERQSYRGEIEVVMVDDCSPDQSRQIAEAFASGVSLRRESISAQVLSNQRNIGNCGSRNRGIVASRGDIVVVIDADCLINRTFIEEHVRAHRRERAEVVIGPLNIETGDLPPMEALAAFERDPGRASREAALQDPVNRTSFVNCITRNFSVRRSAIHGDLFDEDLSYSKDPQSGFGWEDVEMGYRLFSQGARIAFIEEAFSLHVSHPPSVEEGSKPARSMRNFRRMLEKHPEMAHLARRWVSETFGKIVAWAESCAVALGEDREVVEKLLSVYPQSARARARRRDLRVLTHRWHCPHQYELYKLPYRFTLVQNLGPSFVDQWNYHHRPMPSNASFARVGDIDVNAFDVAILHFDENALAPGNTNGTLEHTWGATFTWMRRNLRIPIVAVCHGTPQFYGQYHRIYSEPDLGKEIEVERQRLVDFLDDIPVVCNSYQAQREWGFKNSRVIWQGFDPSEFQLSSYQRGVLTLGAAMRERPYYRGFQIFQEVERRLPRELELTNFSNYTPPANRGEGIDRWSRRHYRNYIDCIRRFSVYFNPTIRSPMPRSRGEAMMAGLVTVSYTSHDVEMFIKNGYDGFYSSDPAELADYLSFLHRNPAELRAIGARGRRTAVDTFNHDRYLTAWQDLLQAVA